MAAAYGERWILGGTIQTAKDGGKLRLPTLLSGWRLDVGNARRLKLEVVRRGEVLLQGRLDAGALDLLAGFAVAVCTLRTKSRVPYLRSVHVAEGRALQIDELFGGDVELDFDGAD